MRDILFLLIGGMGLFLIGMKLLSDGLVAFAGENLRRALTHFTGTPCRAFISGALITALVQSSTATTVTLIGFVSAGLITFTQAIGVVIGASLGNTATGWVVAGLGLKINLGFYTLPLIGIGALLKLLGRRRWAELGLALAGFGMLFLGLNTLQDGMRELAGIFNLAQLPVGGYGARITIMLIGLVMTAVLQSSTAAIAMTLTALHTGTINFDQAASMVIGASIGTTLTGILVTIGGTVYAKRTAAAHILFNLSAGLMAILLLPVFLVLVRIVEQHFGVTPGALSIALFHTLFIGVGVVVFMPLTPWFARMVERLLPEPHDDTATHLDASLLTIPTVALDAAQRTLEQMTGKLLVIYDEILSMSQRTTLPQELARLQRALNHAFDFISRIPLQSGDDIHAACRIAQLHAIDHLLRLRSRLHDLAQTETDFSSPVYQWALEQTRELLSLVRTGLSAGPLDDRLDQIQRVAATLTSLSHQNRHELLRETGSGHGASGALLTTEAFRGLERTGNHIWRICHYLAQSHIITDRGATGQKKSTDMSEENSVTTDDL
ncbi:MAG: Na/Pi symporter [Pseudomonadales bacterium]